MRQATYKLYLDDIRTPKGEGFVVVRSYDAFVDYIKVNGMPAYISFDHDIASYNKDGREMTGVDAAHFIVDMCLDHGLACPEFNVHSANPIGADNIESILTGLTNYLNKTL